MNSYIDISSRSVNKYGEELCGDHVEQIQTEDGMIVVLADGLGSGVKANILATLTSKIAITMLKEGASIEETIYTITNTLPECQVRKLAYSTFTIIEVKQCGSVYMVEYDNPPVFYYRRGESFPLYKEKRTVNGKDIFESKFTLREGDTLTVVSDGAVHAGVGMSLNLGWQWENIRDYLKDVVMLQDSSEGVTTDLLEVCKNLYGQRPGDDTTVVTVRIGHKKYVDVFAGPPKEKEEDEEWIEKIKTSPGKIILCGGTTANIVSRELKEPIRIDLENYTAKVPPMGYIRGIDLVTEGLLTLNAVKEHLKICLEQKEKEGTLPKINEENGAARILKVLLYEATSVHFWIGQAVNPAHQNPNFPAAFNLKNKVIVDIAEDLRKLGKEIEITYM